MQKKPPPPEQHLIKEMENLIASIKSKKAALTEEILSLELGYNDKAISQARSRGVSQKFLNQLKGYLSGLQNVTAAPPAVAAAPADALTELLLINKDLAKANKDLAAAGKDLAAANLQLANDHSELVQIAKKAFNWPSIRTGPAEQGRSSNTKGHPAKQDLALDKKERQVKGK